MGLKNLYKKYGKPPKGVLVDQKPIELTYFIELLKARKPKTILEIGQYDGGTMYYLEKYSPDDCKIIGLDIDHTRYKLPYSKKVELVTSDSSLEDTFNLIKKKMPIIDFLFIDGHHLSPVVDKDYEYYGSLVKNGVIIFHDINWIFDENHKSYDPARSVGDLWLEITQQYPNNYLEIIEEPQPAPLSYGLGILFKGNSVRMVRS